VKRFVRGLALTLRWISILPAFVIGMSIAGVVRLAWGKSSRWDQGIWWVILDEKSWPMRTWYKPWAGTTFGPTAVMLAPDFEHDASTVRHEAHHAEQQDAEAVAGFLFAVLLAAFGHFVFAAIVWCTIGHLVYFAARVVAVSRGEDGYDGNVMEEGAYGVGDREP
jgi:hypothetical protein